ncbi:MAG: radical SAM protein [Desulfobacterales bacterium]|nr:radical SAM protein [Desulfobacterales bacterium]
MSRIILVNPSLNDPAVTDNLCPSGALVLMGTMAHNSGHNVKITHIGVDASMSQFSDLVGSFKPEIVGITMNTFQTRAAKQISKIVKEKNRKTQVVVGGPHPSALKSRIFDTFPLVDVVVVGEGEHTFLELAEGKPLEKIRGACYNGKMNEPRPLAENLDYLPLPNLDLVDISKFTGVPPVGAYPSAYTMASRGCPFHCTFCSKSVWENRVRYRKPGLVIEEIKWLHEKYRMREIFFQDDTFNLNREWAEELLNLIIDNKLNKEIVYKAPFRANEKLVDEGLLRLAKKAGFWLIFYGVESGNQGMLNGMKKGLTVGEIKRAFKLTHQVGLKTTASFIIGMPSETKETISDSVALWREIKPHDGDFSPAIPLPGTELEKTVIQKRHLLTQDYDEYSPKKVLVRTDTLTKEDLERYRARAVDTVALSTLSKNKKRAISYALRNPVQATRRILGLMRGGSK